jgi:hypothetical protein
VSSESSKRGESFRRPGRLQWYSMERKAQARSSLASNAWDLDQRRIIGFSSGLQFEKANRRRFCRGRY